jgi:hypothetical protein
MRSKQTGITLLGWLFLLLPLGVCGYAALRLTPVYLNYMKVARSLEEVKTEFKDGGGDAAAIRKAIDKRFNIEDVDYPGVKDIKINRDGKGWMVAAEYDDQAPLFSNVFILVSFNKSVTFGGEVKD